MIKSQRTNKMKIMKHYNLLSLIAIAGLLIFGAFPRLFAQVTHRKSIPAEITRKLTNQKEILDFPGDIMSFPASGEAVESFLQAYPNQVYFTFPEHRSLPVQLLDSLPRWWLQDGQQPLGRFEAQARPGEFYVFQIGVFAARQPLENVRLEFEDLAGPQGSTIDASAFNCFNTEGIGFRGEYFTKRVDVSKDKVQPLWIGLYVPENAIGFYSGKVSVIPENAPVSEIALALSVYGPPIAKHGDREGWRHTRLRWLNSQIAMDEQVTEPYLPIERNRQRISILGRSLDLDETGLPGQLKSYFSKSNTRILETAEDILVRPVQLSVVLDGKVLQWQTESISFIEQAPDRVTWQATSRSGPLTMHLTGRMEYDGFVDYEIGLSADQDLNLDDVQLKVLMEESASTYMMGLGRQGGYRPETWSWKWDRTKHQDAVWLGGVNAGLRFKFKAKEYVRPLINIYYEYGPLNLPESWYNDGKGSVSISEREDGNVLLNASGGPRIIRKGDSLHFNFEMLITPLKILNTEQHWTDRYYHGRPIKPEKIRDRGANVINVHHAQDINPFINYPYYDESFDSLKEFVEEAHELDMRVKPYYTTRELTVELPEFWALRSLDGEVIYPGPGNEVKTVINRNGPHPWLRKNVKRNYIPAWVHRFRQGRYEGKIDLSVITTPDSRWNNFYIGGLNYMVQEAKIDGMYIDDSALDRYTLRRARKILDRNRPEPRIDMHSWNHFNDMAGWASCANIYMDLYPYIDRLWLGEGFDYGKSADYWLVEISGIPFGLMSEMLQGGGNPWRGMVYGMTNRLGHSGDPTALWKLWDDFGIHDADMIGYWDPANPVQVTGEKVLATAYIKPGKILVSFASWEDEQVETRIMVDWKNLNMDPDNVHIYAPEIKDIQEADEYRPEDKITVSPGKGRMVIIESMMGE